MKNLEICCADYNSVLAAIEGGAQRVELCTGLNEGGMTPSAGLIEAAVATGIRVHVLIRPRGGDFVYSDAEKRIMLSDIRIAKRCGVSGVVVGALNEDGAIDREFLDRCLDEAGGMSVTFHRAFDCCINPIETLDMLIDAGVDYLLTSGHAPDAMDGAPLLRNLMARASGRIKIIAAAGINSSNIERLADETGCMEFHASARRITDGGDDSLFPGFYASDAGEIKQLRTILDK